jgi:hypothetical protein
VISSKTKAALATTKLYIAIFSLFIVNLVGGVVAAFIIAVLGFTAFDSNGEFRDVTPVTVAILIGVFLLTTAISCVAFWKSDKLREKAATSKSTQFN